MIVVLASIELNPGKREEFLAEFRRIVPLVRAERGCQEYFSLGGLFHPFACAGSAAGRRRGCRRKMGERRRARGPPDRSAHDGISAESEGFCAEGIAANTVARGIAIDA